jgi:hypothetical protein
MKLTEIDEAAKRGDIPVDGKIVLESRPLKNADGSVSDAYPGVEINIGKAAVEPVWYLPGVADRFGMYVACRTFLSAVTLTYACFFLADRRHSYDVHYSRTREGCIPNS